MSPSHSRHSPPSLELSPRFPDELVLEILLRIPPDRPECLVRASCVSKDWRRALSDSDPAAFCRRYRDFHRTPPMLGFFFTVMLDSCHGRGFVPTTAFRARITAPTPSSTWELVVNSRHGRVLVYRPMHADFIVWDPMIGDQRRVPIPSLNSLSYRCAVLCAMAGCDHRGCHGGPFLVALVHEHSACDMFARVYSSEDGAWSDVTSVQHPDGFLSMVAHTSVLLGNTVYMPWGTIITAYNLDDRQLNSIDVPSAHYNHESSILMTAHDGALGFAGLEESKLLHLWSRKAGPDGAMAWAQDRVIDLGRCYLLIASPTTLFWLALQMVLLSFS